jgi:ribosomal protein S18 acetylase RimI-like enzyme
MSGYSNICPNVISILDLCVSQKEQGKGVGKKMLKDFLQKHQNMTVELCVLSANTKAIELYKSCGFQQYGGEEQAYPKSRGVDHTRITMRWKKES